MRKTFEPSSERTTFLEYLNTLMLGQQVTFISASKLLKFPVTTVLCCAVRAIVRKRQYRFLELIYPEGSRKAVGFVLTGKDGSINTTRDGMKRAGRQSKKAKSSAIIGLERYNLTRDEHQQMSENLSKINIMLANSEPAKSNRPRQEPPPLEDPIDPYAHVRHIK